MEQVKKRRVNDKINDDAEVQEPVDHSDKEREELLGSIDEVLTEIGETLSECSVEAKCNCGESLKHCMIYVLCRSFGATHQEALVEVTS